MSGQPSVLQVVILRDGLLIGTEVFVPGTYSIGSEPGSDLMLDDASIEPRHAVLYFQNGRSAIQDAGTVSGVYVNGHRVSACEIRPVDEVLCGPFVLKTRVLSQRPDAKPQPPPEVAALLGAPPQAAPSARPGAPRAPLPPSGGVTTAPQWGTAAPPAELSASTVPIAYASPGLSARPSPAHAMEPALEPVLVDPLPGGPSRGARGASLQASPAAAPRPVPVPMVAPSPMPASTIPSARRRATQEAPRVDESLPSLMLADDLLSGLDLDEPPLPEAKPAATPDARPRMAPRMAPGKGPSQLYLELYWGNIRREALRFRPGKKPLRATSEPETGMPLWGFSLPEGEFTLAESLNGAYRLFVPPGTGVERSGADGRFQALNATGLESDGNRRFVTVREGAAVRLSQGQMSLVAYAAPVPERTWVNPLKGLPWLALASFAFFASALGAFIALKPPLSEAPDFTQKNLPPIALRLLAPEPKKKEEAKKKLEAIKQKAKPKETPEKVAEKPTPKPVEKTPPPKQKEVAPPPPPESRALKALAKLSAAGPAANDLLAAVDKLGSGPGSKNAKSSNYKLAGLIGKAPIANAGLGTFGLGGGGKGGGATLGAEILRGKGGGGIGALGAGGVGKGKVGGTVTRATARSVSAAQGSIDREAVAKVINSHLQEVHACYERALLKDPGLAGKVVLEWTIGNNGRVAAAKTKSSTLRNSAVESCILSNLKTWSFPSPKGGVVIITYPFLFNSVGY
ncbi:AgmX/PglI C-terminal domain-containing protein [Stigmatella sp. ncwal1]|uniref:AgmX/PglI C-terminal domain-containing protein n=1 Tax=Stigmatella ashevillensis TaxID=2995309 RepID=A0ABT5DJC6_9BACT|nr:AgmX/PglI C-terminal domain-containing protein [Stigmatella ashevillena]MDC0713756.1 AgmX/PglI C-terminal domain-containing protein [Stigmatella ashevillena]